MGAVMLPMPKPRFPYLERFATRHGKLIWYFRVGKGPRTRLPDEYGSPAFLAAYSAALAGQNVPEAQDSRTLGWLIHQFYNQGPFPQQSRRGLGSYAP